MSEAWVHASYTKVQTEIESFLVAALALCQDFSDANV